MKKINNGCCFICGGSDKTHIINIQSLKGYQKHKNQWVNLCPLTQSKIVLILKTRKFKK